MICKNCGKEIPDGTKFCTECGAVNESASSPAQAPAPTPVAAPVQQTVVQRTVTVPAPTPVQKKTYTVKKGKGSGWIVFARILLWLSFAGIILWGITMGIVMIAAGAAGGGSGIQEAEIGGFVIPAVSGSAMILAGIFTMLGSVILAFVTVCGGFILLDACVNLKNMNDNLCEIIKISAENNNTGEKINATLYEILRK